jgi:hypothetical protein
MLGNTSAVLGEVEIRSNGAMLEANFLTKGYVAPLTHWYHDTYGVDWVEEAYGPIPVTFWFEAGGSAEYIVSPWGIAQRG